MDTKVTLTDDEWRQRLTPEQYKVLRKASTERPFTGQYVHVNDKGVYTCAGCGAELFTSDTKFDSGTGWPSFYAPANNAAVEEHRDWSMGIPRTEVRCASCGGHLGHVFPDGPAAHRPAVLHELLRAEAGEVSGLMPLEPSVRARAVLEQTFGFAEFRPGQADVVAASEATRRRALRRADRLWQEHRVLGAGDRRRRADHRRVAAHRADGRPGGAAQRRSACRRPACTAR